MCTNRSLRLPERTIRRSPKGKLWFIKMVLQHLSDLHLKVHYGNEARSGSRTSRAFISNIQRLTLYFFNTEALSSSCTPRKGCYPDNCTKFARSPLIRKPCQIVWPTGQLLPFILPRSRRCLPSPSSGQIQLWILHLFTWNNSIMLGWTVADSTRQVVPWEGYELCDWGVLEMRSLGKRLWWNLSRSLC